MARLALLLLGGCQLVFPLGPGEADPDGAPPPTDALPTIDCEEIGLIGCFGFDDTTTDGTGLNIVSPRQVEFDAGVDGRAVRMTPTSRLDIAAAKFGVQSEVTIETWIFLDGNRTVDQLAIDYDGCWALGVGQNNEVLCYGLLGPVTSMARLAPNMWNHIACTQVEDDQISIFVNGEPDVSESKQSLQLDGCSTAAIGGDAPEGKENSPLDGRLDRFRIWSASRTPTQLKAEYDAFSSRR